MKISSALELLGLDYESGIVTFNDCGETGEISFDLDGDCIELDVIKLRDKASVPENVGTKAFYISLEDDDDEGMGVILTNGKWGETINGDIVYYVGFDTDEYYCTNCLDKKGVYVVLHAYKDSFEYAM